MKVLHVTPSIARSYGGPTQSLAGFARAATVAGVECAVATPSCVDDDLRSFQVAAPGTLVLRFPSRGAGAFIRSPQLLRFLKHEARSFDAIHIHGLLNLVSSLAARVCRKVGVPYVIRPFGTLSRYTYTHRRSLLKRLYFRYLDDPNLRAVSAMHFTTETEREEAAWRGTRFGGRGFIVPPPVASRMRRAPAKSRLAGEEGRVLFLSRLHPVKNLELLLDAWTLLTREAPRVRLIVAGDGDRRYVNALHHRVNTLGIGASVDFVGFVHANAKDELYAHAEVFVLPSRHENFGVAVLEALAVGLPVVLTSEVQLASFVERHRLGSVVEANPRMLAAAIANVLRDDAFRADVRRRAPTLVNSEFGLESVGEKLLEMYAVVAQKD